MCECVVKSGLSRVVVVAVVEVVVGDAVGGCRRLLTVVVVWWLLFGTHATGCCPRVLTPPSGLIRSVRRGEWS